MFLPRHVSTSRRRAMILMVTLALLTLFAIVGITFVFYAQSSSTASLHWREADQKGFVKPDIDPDVLMRWALNQLLYDVPDDASGVTSAMRGNSMARNKYGFNDAMLNTQPHNGIGALHYANPTYGGDDFNMVNHTYFQADNFIRDPERIGARANLGSARGPFTGGVNPPYTYPDRNAMFVGATRADGTLIQPSFHRPELFGSLAPTNPNWASTSPQGKYLTLRPRPADMGPGFPFPASPTGDVQARTGEPGAEDAIWIDLGYPVMTAADGRKFKPLFAFYVEALDGRPNINTSGNLMLGAAPNQTHASNHGLGRWEVSLAPVLPIPSGAVPEWPRVLLGNGSITGRYGADFVPGQAAPPPSVASVKQTRTRFFAQLDWNAADENAGNGVTGVFQLPGVGQTDPFPRFPAGYGNKATAGEVTNHGSIFLTGNDRAVGGASDVHKLLVDGPNASTVNTSEIAQLCPNNLDPSMAAPPGQRPNRDRRRLVTTFSASTNRMGMAPYVWNQSVPAMSPTGRPVGPAIPSPDLASQRGATPANSEFGANDWRAWYAFREKIDLARNLPAYPHQANGTGPMPGMNGYHDRFDLPAGAPAMTPENNNIQQQLTAARNARKQLARELYDRLCYVTGLPQAANATPPDPELQVRRYLAQIAVNIVDYIDEDEISTPFNFYSVQDGLPPGNIADSATNPATSEKIPKYWVFGTELPPIVLNEVLTEFQYPTNAGMVMNGTFQVKVWAELMCTFGSTPPVLGTGYQGQDAQKIPFHMLAGAAGSNAYHIYEIDIANTKTPGNPLYQVNDNVLGAPDVVRTANKFDSPNTTTVGGAAVETGINPSVTRFFLAGPGDDRDGTIAARVPANTPFWASKSMMYDVEYNNPNWQDAMGNPKDDRTNGLTVVLRRLANPHLPWSEDPTSADYNPYVTVDYIEGIKPINDATTAGSKYQSLGKQQPYAADRGTQIVVQPIPAGNIGHTFGAMNDPGAGVTITPEWLVHLDRELASPIELLQVSERRPHELTQRFITGAGKHQHRVPWFDEDLAAGQSHRLYRLFAHLMVKDRGWFTSGGPGIVAGKININMIFDPEVLLALLDASNGARSNFFSSAEIYNPSAPADPNTVWGRLLALRSPNLATSTLPYITTNDKPFQELDTGLRAGGDALYPAGTSINDTLFRSASGGNGASPRLFQTSGQTHPYVQMEMMSKLANNVTTTSNSFAVWCVTGFFEVTQDTDAAGNPIFPVKLGREIGALTGTSIRHRFFAVVDRTAFVVADYLATSAGAPINPIASGAPQWMTVNPKSSPADPLNGLTGSITYLGTPTPVAWNIVQGSLLIVGRGTNEEEIVVVTQADPANNRFEAVFVRAHGVGTKITMPGNPGPQAFSTFLPGTPMWNGALPLAVVTQ